MENLDLSVPEGAFLSLIGPSGCGKSTLIRILANLCDATIGRVTIRIDATQTRPLHAVVFQEYALFPWRTALENVAFGLEMRGIPKRERQEIAQTYLVRMGLARFAHHYPHQLSGGMQQRIAIARAFANNPEILLMDEPFGALDAQTRMRMQTELLQMWEEEHKTVLYITHSIEEALILGDRVALMTARPGKIHRIYPVALPRPRNAGNAKEHRNLIDLPGKYGMICVHRLDGTMMNRDEEKNRSEAAYRVYEPQKKTLTDLRRDRVYRMFSICSPFFVLFIWEFMVRVGALDHRFFPPPSRVFAVIGQMIASGELFKHLGISL